MGIEDIKKVAVLGAGIMGHGIAQSFLMGGYPVKLYDIEASALDAAEAHIRRSMELFREFELLSDTQMKQSLESLHKTTDLKDAGGDGDFIMEAAPEDLALKQDLFEQVESCCSDATIIATNTSSFTLKDIGEKVKNKQRLVTAHWFNPPQIVPIVEVVRGEKTSDDTFEITYGLLQKIKKFPVKINADIPGFLVNRISGALTREIFYLYEKGVASVEDIDRAISGVIGFQFASIGPFRRMDSGGLDLWFQGMDRSFSLLSNATKGPESLRRLVEQGHLGIKSGKGFYDYSVDFSQGEQDEAFKKRDQEFMSRLKRLYLKV